MFIPKGQQSYGTLVTMSLARRRAIRHVQPAATKPRVIAVNDCSDNTTYHNKARFLCLLNGLKDDDFVPVSFFGGIIQVSPYYPDYDPAAAKVMLDEIHRAVAVLGASVIYAGSHGEHCGLCKIKKITVAQRYWLAWDAVRILKDRAEREEWAKQGGLDTLDVVATYHRKCDKGSGILSQKTRAIVLEHDWYKSADMRRLMTISDAQYIEAYEPDLLKLAAAQ